LSATLALAGSARAELRVVPTPAMDALEPAVREQVSAARANLDRRLAAGESSGPELAADFGLLGLLYYLYDLQGAAEPCLLNVQDLAPEDFRWPFYLGVLAQSEGDFESAAVRFERALELAPDDVATQLHLAAVRLELGDVDVAAAIYTQHEEGPAAAAALYGSGRIAEYRGETARAAVLFERALALQPEANGIHHRLGMAYRQLGDLERAREHLAQNRGVQVRFPDPLIEDLGQLLQASQVYFKAGIDALKVDDAAAAVPQLLKARELNGEDPLVHYNLALAYLHLGDDEAAEESLLRSVEVDPGFRNGYFNLGTLQAEQGRLIEAEASFRRAYEIDAQDGEAHREWAVALAMLGRTNQAGQELVKVLAEYPTDVRARLNLAALQEAAGDTAGALANLERASADGSAEADLYRALLLERLGRRDEALEVFALGAAKDPQSAEIQEQWALALGRAGKFGAAAARFDAALALSPESKSAHVGRAMSRLLGADEPAARADLEASLETLPADPDLALLLARLLVAGTVDSVRDPAKGLMLARDLQERYPSPEHAQTLAMAYAAVGRFADAVLLQRSVVAELERGGTPKDVERGRSRLSLYEDGRPCRAPWRDE
jgi:tetratricopeptide (TPR) repeat protein